MNLNDGDLEFIFSLYDSAKSVVNEKDRLTLAEEFVRHMIEYGMEIKTFAQEVGEHDEYLDEAVEHFLEQNEDSDDEEYWYSDEDEWE